MRYRLRTLLILLAVGPIIGAFVYWQVERAIEARRQKRTEIVVEFITTQYFEDTEGFPSPEPAAPESDSSSSFPAD